MNDYSPEQVGKELIRFIEEQELAYMDEFGHIKFTNDANYAIGRYIIDRTQEFFGEVETVDISKIE